MLGIRISVYNGVRFFSFTVDGEKLGHRVGEFAPTRKKPIPKKKKK
jgi:ribosomal protein S19